MKTGLSIGKHIAERLLSSEELQPLVAGRIYPIAAVSGTKRPYICYTRTGIVPEWTKDGWECDSVNVAVEIVSERYETAVELAEMVRSRLEDNNVDYGDYEVRAGELLRAVEGYALELDAYLISLEFSFEVI